MSMQGIHFLGLDNARSRLRDVENRYEEASVRLDEAIKLGDLRENSEYDIAKELSRKLTAEMDELSSAILLPVVRSSDNVPTIEEGSVVEVTVHSVTKSPIPVGSPEFDALKQGEPAFRGTLMFGATLSVHELIADNALSTDTPIGKYILGKQSGDYNVPVLAGFANITVRKLSSDTTTEQLYCSLGGVRL